MKPAVFSFALFGNEYHDNGCLVAKELARLLMSEGSSVAVDEDYARHLSAHGCLPQGAAVFSFLPPDVGMALSIGGDGTFLQTATKVGGSEVPIAGINTGRLGFLADYDTTDLPAVARELTSGSYSIEERALLEVQADGLPVSPCCHALNDVAILKRDTAAMLTIHVEVDGERLATYQADGIIAATPTGSTAYSLSNGGPVIAPGTRVFSLTAVAPHSLTTRPVVISDSSLIDLHIESRSHTFLVAIDGRSVAMPEETVISLRRADHNVRVEKHADTQYFATLRKKMMWGVDWRK